MGDENPTPQGPPASEGLKAFKGIQQVNSVEDVKASLAARGYDLVNADDSDSDGGMPGRIPSLEPGLAREKGKKAFEAGKYDRAIKYWQGGLKAILSSLCSGPEALQNQSLSELDLTLNLNIAMAYMKKGDFDAAERSVDKALSRRDALPPHQITKALYRKATTQRAQHRLPECLETLKDLLEVEGGHAAALQMKQEVDREWKKQCQAQKKNLGKMFSKMADEDKKESDRLKKIRDDLRASSGVRWTEDDVDSGAFERGESPGSDGKDWGLALSRTVLWSVEQFSVEGRQLIAPGTPHAAAWFVGCSSTCELRHLQPSALMSRLPALRSLEVVLNGFMGEYDPDNKRIPDPKEATLPKGLLHTTVGDDQHVFIRIVKGTLEAALEDELMPEGGGPQAKAKALEEPKRFYGDGKEAFGKAKPEAGGEAAAADPAVAEAGVVEPPPAAAASPGPLAAPLASPLVAGAGPLAAPIAPPVPELVPDGDDEPPPMPEPRRNPMEPKPTVPPHVCFIAHPQLHRYFSDFFPAIKWLIENEVPTVIIGASEPDHSWKQDEILLKALGAEIIVGKRESPYPMSLPDNPKVKKCNHIIGFCGGKALQKDQLTKKKLELLSQDYTIR